jgi:predicted RNase H-like nuclease (RuvC/YqgF family)
VPSDGATLERSKSSDDSKLDISNLDTAASATRLKIQKAKNLVKDMPDIDRTVEDQQDEIEELELRVKRQKAMLSRLGVHLDAPKVNAT